MAAFALITTPLVGYSGNKNKSGIPALFDTKAEAEKAPRNFNCTGAHQMKINGCLVQITMIHKLKMTITIKEWTIDKKQF